MEIKNTVYCNSHDTCKQDQKLEAIARAICVGVEEEPDHVGDAQGNEFRWQDYLAIAEKVLDITIRYDDEASILSLWNNAHECGKAAAIEVLKSYQKD
jgi:hypothetical protein